MVSGPDDLIEVVTGSKGVLSRPDRAPKLLVDCFERVDRGFRPRSDNGLHLGVAMLAAPVSGNAKVVKAGLLSVVASGPEAQFKIAEPYLALARQWRFPMSATANSRAWSRSATTFCWVW